MSHQSETEYPEPGRRSFFTCPEWECNGSLTEMEEGGLLGFRCHEGHTYSQDRMLAAQAEALEASLWAAARCLEESAATITGILLKGDTITESDGKTA